MGRIFDGGTKLVLPNQPPFINRTVNVLGGEVKVKISFKRTST